MRYNESKARQIRRLGATHRHKERKKKGNLFQSVVITSNHTQNAIINSDSFSQSSTPLITLQMIKRYD